MPTDLDQLVLSLVSPKRNISDRLEEEGQLLGIGAKVLVEAWHPDQQRSGPFWLQLVVEVGSQLVVVTKLSRAETILSETTWETWHFAQQPL